MPGRYDDPMRLPDIPLAILASARLSRLVVTDDLGKWWVKEPVDRAMDLAAETMEVEPWWWRYRSGLDCPWCVGFWLGGLLLLGHLLLPRTVWRGVAGALALNYASTHLGSRLGDYGTDNADDAVEQGHQEGEDAR